MKKIAFVSTMEGSRWGGSEKFWSDTALCLAQRGVCVSANVRWWPDPAAPLQQLAQAGCTMEWRGTPPPVLLPARRGLRRRVADRLRRRLGCFPPTPPRPPHYDAGAWLEQARPDLVVISLGYYREGLDWMQRCRKRAVPYALLVQAVGDQAWPDDATAAALAESYEHAVACFSVAQANIESLRAILATPLPNAKVVRNPFNVAYDAAPPWPAPAGRYKLACVARLEPISKGQDLLLRVLCDPKWRSRPLEVTLFGDGPSQQTLEKLQHMHGLANLRFGGFARDIEAVWATHHGLVLPSRYEGLPLALVEALLCARTCIVTDVAGNAELIQNDVTGFVAAGPSVACLDEAMERAWRRRDEWQAIGQHAAQQVRQQVPRDPAAVFADELLSRVV